MATHSSILAWRIPLDRGAWWATDHGVAKESDTTEWLRTQAVCLVAQSCPPLCDPMDCSQTRLLCACNFPGKITGVDCHFLLPRDLLDPGIEPASRGFPCGSMEKNLLQCRRGGFYPWVMKILWNRKLQPTSVLLPGKFRGQLSLADYSPCGCKRVRHDWVTKQRIRPHPASYLSTIWQHRLLHPYSNNLFSLPDTLFSVQFSSVTHSCPTLCDLMDCSTPDFPVHHQLLEPA